MSAPAVAFAAPADVELAPNPINPAWIIDERLSHCNARNVFVRKCQTGSDLTLDVAESFACRAIALRAMRAWSAAFV
jgi:hypothetical protein